MNQQNCILCKSTELPSKEIGEKLCALEYFRI